MSTRNVVALAGWTVGFQTIDMMKLIVQRTPLGLKDAMEAVNRVVEGETVCLEFADEEEAQTFLVEAVRTGAIARLERPER